MGLKYSKEEENLPVSLSIYQCRDILAEITNLFQKNREELMLDIKIDHPSFKYIQKDWRKSNVIGKAKVFVPKQDFYGHVAVVKNMYDVEAFSQKKQQKQQQLAHDTPTPNSNQLQEQQQKQCCICCERKTTTVLPCSHSFCANCTSQYIIEQQLRKCPICRTEFTGNKQAVQKTFYEIIQEEKLVYEEARAIILDHLKKYNSKIVDNLKRQIYQINQMQN